MADIIGARLACTVAMISSVDPLEGDRGRAEVGVAELALDHIHGTPALDHGRPRVGSPRPGGGIHA